MSIISPPPYVKPFLAVFGTDEEKIISATKHFAKDLGSPDVLSASFKITETDYYEKEMGQSLIKKYVTWPTLMLPENLVDLKLWAMELEKQYAKNGKREVNLDPGYIFVGGLVLSTGKFTGHRLFLGRGIWGELTVFFHKGEFKSFDWTYPDYASKKVQEVLHTMRKKYVWQLNNPQENIILKVNL